MLSFFDLLEFLCSVDSVQHFTLGCTFSIEKVHSLYFYIYKNIALFQISVDSPQHSKLPLYLINAEYGATLQQVLEIAGLSNDYAKYLQYNADATNLFSAGSTRAAFDVFYKIWYDPYIVPALLLRECFYNRRLVLPRWGNNKHFAAVTMLKKNGGYRPIIVPPIESRVCMGVINTIFQAACPTWSVRTTGFKPNSGTVTAITLLRDQAKNVLKNNYVVYIASFDVYNAYNSINVQDLFNTLQLHYIPLPMKKLLWQWHHTPLYDYRYGVEFEQLTDLYQGGSSSYANGAPVQVGGLLQGLSFSPTLFAWYLDKKLVSKTNIVCYADNFAFAAPDLFLIQDTINNTSSILKNAGLSLQKTPITCVNSVDNHIFHWLGHSLHLPVCSTTLSDFTTKKPQKTAHIISVDTWKDLLSSSNWIKNVRLNDWRYIK